MKSAYHVQSDIPHRERGGNASSSFRFLEETWKKFWHTPFLPKARNVVWRAMHNTVAVCENLVKKKVPIENFYPMCDKPSESIKHLFFKYLAFNCNNEVVAQF